MSNQYLISGATGATGSKTVEFLLEAGVKVRAYVHRHDERSAALSALGAELVTGDLLDFEAVCRAMEGVKGAYFVYPIMPGIIQATAYFVEAAKEAAVSAIVNMSHTGFPSRSSTGPACQPRICDPHCLRNGPFTGPVKSRPAFCGFHSERAGMHQSRRRIKLESSPRSC